MSMREPIVSRSPPSPHKKKRLIFAEGHDARVLQAIATIVRDRTAVVFAVGCEQDILKRIVVAKLSIKVGDDFEIVEPTDERQFFDQWLAFRTARMLHWNVTNLPGFIRDNRNTACAARLINSSRADAMICGASGEFAWHLLQLQENLMSLQRQTAGTLQMLYCAGRVICLVEALQDCLRHPTAIAEIAIAAARHVCAFNLSPSIDLCQDSYWKDLNSQAETLRAAAATVRAMAPDLVVRAPVALADAIRPERCRSSCSASKAACEVLVFPRVGLAAAIKDTLLSQADWQCVGPFLLGTANRAHIVSPTVSSSLLTRIAAHAGTPLDESHDLLSSKSVSHSDRRGP
ncbi:hypothetical protein E0H59_04430 [Rhizobium leguminosarum bv. viciae]|nr:hypothetical protein E0H59_04430 [Rhizobium leguminosarum bv. viciae]